MSAHPDSDPVHRPKFRLLAAATMIGMLAAGTASIGFVSFTALRNLAVMMGLVPAPAAIPDASPTDGFLTSLWELSRLHGFIELAAVGIAMLVFAFLLRKIVLSGLRD